MCIRDSYSNALGIRLRSGATGAGVRHNTVVSNTNAGIQCDAGASAVTIKANIAVTNGAQVTNNCTATTGSNVIAGSPLFTNAGASDYTLSLIHISEPTRLLSISYAVFCLKKKKT